MRDRIVFMQRVLFVITVVLGYCAAASSQETVPILGVLEDTPGHYAGDPHYHSVRVVFTKRASDWIPYPVDCLNPECQKTYPKQVNWAVSFDGQRVGTLTSELPNEFEFYSTVGQERITSKTPVPTIGKSSQSYGGFLGQPVYRPLIANSQSFFADPEKWKRTRLPNMLVSRVRQAFREKFPKVSNCNNPDENKESQWHYTEENVHILSAYSSLKGWSVVRVELEPYRCDGPSDDPFVDQWFVLEPNSQIHFLGRAMWLVDAGDYDNDGHSEIVFSIDDYNSGGYILFYGDFKKSATFKYGYH